MLDREGPVRLFRQVADILRAKIRDGELVPGNLVPSEASLQAEYGIARATARRAIRELREAGLVYSRQGEGTFVGPEDAARTARGNWTYQRIAAELAEDIQAGTYRPNRPIPSEAHLSQRFECAKGTVRQALALMREQGWVYTLPQQGTYVSEPRNWPSN
ncbi:GntR family transcriptional regulator [Herbidospora sp. RD11066]